MIFIFVFIVINFEKAVFSLSIQEMETIFSNDMIHRQANTENPLCDLSGGQKITFCRAVFELPRFKVTIEAEFNKQAFYRYEPPCLTRKIRFISLNLPNGWDQKILLCFGRHRIVRTSWREDTFFDKFFVVFSQLYSILYVVGEKRSGDLENYYLVDVATVTVNPLSLPESEVTTDELREEEYLNDIETHETKYHLAEAMYVRDMIRNTDHFTNPFENMEPEKMLTVCLSVFMEIRYTRRGIFIDRQAMFTRPYEPVQKSVHFLYEGKRDGHPQMAYPCPALHAGPPPIKSLTLKDMLSIVAGRKDRSIFVFEMIDLVGNVRLVDYIENFDFDNLLPSEPSETEIYPNTEQRLQDIQSSVQAPFIIN